jgi:hypothetical protein
MKRKVKAGVLGGAIATLFVLTVSWLTGSQAPPGFEGALATVVGGGLAWFVPELADDPPAE